MDMDLLLHNFQNFHGAGLDADAAGNALGSGTVLGHDHDVHWAGFNALAAGNALLLVDHVHTGLGVLGDGLVLTGAHALAALDAGIGLGTGALGHDLDAAEGHVIYLIESFGTSLNTLQASHTFGIFLNSELLHNREISFTFLIHYNYTRCIDKKQPIKSGFSNFLVTLF